MQSYPPEQQPTYGTNQPTWIPASQQTPPPPPMQSYPPYGMQPPPQPPKRRRRWPWVVGIIVILFVIIAVASAANAGGSNAPASTPTPTAQVQASAPTAQPTPAPTATPGGNKIGQPVSLSGWLITVNSVKHVAGSGFNTPQKPGDIFLWVDVTVRNNTGQSQPVSSLAMFSLKDATGQTYDQSIDTDAPASPDGTLANGGKLRGTLVFEVPKSAHSFEFDFTPDFSGAQASWTFHV